MELNLNISGRGCRNTNFVQFRIHRNTLATSRCNRSKYRKDTLTGLVALAILSVAEHTSSSNRAIECVCMNRHMQVCVECIGRGTTIGHGIILANLHLNTTPDKRIAACLGDFATLSCLGSISVCIQIFRLIRRRQVHSFSHLSFLLIFIQ